MGSWAWLSLKDSQAADRYRMAGKTVAYVVADAKLRHGRKMKRLKKDFWSPRGVLANFLVT